ncbi:15-hydroxyprostaglandin dehydrogenase [NAD(+)]-like [Spodoptera frugiperda]|uniref:15-hydroxyprostaglandin dehydrogenase [NAD(+)]-like n=1 Tax=Spodoptera frugiperda TaxID=7108 RepID=A0A9R0CX74_SPOFR|nr:15-hydroxyprostaglandin dehydrogenase [NAD(+)]-like [Spodoptera frugiperda]
MERSIQNKIVAVVGGAQGIGCAIADCFLLHGAKTAILLDINDIQGPKAEDRLTEKHGKDKAVYIKCDVTTDLETVSKRIIEAYNTIDVLVLSAGTLTPDRRKMMDIYATSVIEWSMKFYEHMRKDNGGCGGTIITISSIFGFRPAPHAPVYQAAKYAVFGFTKSLGHLDNFHKTGVRVMGLCPGFTETILTRRIRDPERQKELPIDLVKFATSLPWQTVEDVGEAAVEVYARADSGTMWLIEGGQPIEEIQ